MIGSSAECVGESTTETQRHGEEVAWIRRRTHWRCLIGSAIVLWSSAPNSCNGWPSEEEERRRWAIVKIVHNSECCCKKILIPSNLQTVLSNLKLPNPSMIFRTIDSEILDLIKPHFFVFYPLFLRASVVNLLKKVIVSIFYDGVHWIFAPNMLYFVIS